MTASPPLHIRTAEDNDLSALTALYRESFPDDPPWNEPQAMIAAKRKVQPEGLLVGINQDGDLVATIKAGYDGHRGWINSLAVKPEERGQDYGKQMMDHAIALLTAWGAVKVNLQIRGGNTSLKAYYESLGFEEEPRISMGILTAEGQKFTS